ncbi:N-acetylmuramoyl-L-alanine amidase [Hydrogenophaga sp.]|uniref:N-acetylmuramoyl-L-alanine amidase n=1 Tax=Hydrogenophaga sp. TaxID=1904254 RepID=UPI00391A8DAE
MRGLPRRDFLQAGVVVLTLGVQHLARGATALSVRIWPAPDYTRVTIESDVPLSARSTFVPQPPRLAVDIEGIDLLPGLRQLVGQLQSNDPNIAGIRVAQNAPNVVRLVIDLKQPIVPQVFHLEPVAAYQHRLVFDLYPANPPDPLEQLISQRLQELDEASSRAARLLGLEARDLGASVKAEPDPLGELIAQRDRPKLPSAPPSPAAPTSTPRSAAVEPAGKPRTPAAQRAAEDQPPPLPQTERLIVIALDPGHGGEDPGAIGPAGTYEKNVVLQIAHKLRERINATSVNGNPMRAYMTRDADFFVPLNMRVAKAQRVQADLFISIHADAFMSERPQGASVYALSTRGASSAAARWMADKENAADLVGGINVRAKDATVMRTLLDMSTTAQINDSLKLGASMLGEVKRVGKLHKPRVEQANFAVLRAPDIPSVLVETAFISNPDEEKRLNDPDYQNQLADALLRGIKRYFAQNPPLARNRQV